MTFEYPSEASAVVEEEHNPAAMNNNPLGQRTPALGTGGKLIVCVVSKKLTTVYRVYGSEPFITASVFPDFLLTRDSRCC